MKNLLLLIIVCFSYSCTKNDEPTPIIDTVVAPPPYVSHYGSYEATAETSCGYDAGQGLTYIEWTFSGVTSRSFYVLNHAVVGETNVKEGTLYWEAKDITCSTHSKSGQVQIVAGKKSYINIKF